MPPFFAPQEHRTDRFAIRRYREGDGAALSQAATSSVDHLRPWLPWAQADQSDAEGEALARRFLAAHLVNTDYTLAITSPDGDRLLGGTGFHLRGRPLRDGVAEIGMWIRASEAGRGLGTAVLQAMLRWGFTDWHWHRLEWRCDERNTASSRTAERAGMRQEGRLRGDVVEEGRRRTTVLYAALREDAA